MFILPVWSFYQGTPSAASTTEPTSAQKRGIGENFFSSSLNVIFFVGEPLLKNSLSLAFHLLPFSSPYICDLKW